MKFPGLEQTLKDLESEIDSINMLHKNWWLAADGAICGACEFVVPALAKRTNAFIDAFARMVRDDNHYAATLFIRPTLEACSHSRGQRRVRRWSSRVRPTHYVWRSNPKAQSSFRPSNARALLGEKVASPSRFSTA